MKGANKRNGGDQKTVAAAKKDVATVEEAGLPAVYDYGDYGGAGFENTSRDDFATPFIYILQSNSPIVEKNEVGSNGLEARAGMLMNSISNELFPADKNKADHEGVAFIACHRDHVYVEWKPNRGGFVAQHGVESEVVGRAKAGGAFGKLKVGEGEAANDLQETFYLYGILIKKDGSWEHVVVPFTSTKIKVYKQFMTRLNTLALPGPGGKKIKPPIFAHRLRLRTVRQENDSGAFYNFDIQFDGDNAAAARLDPNSELFQEAASFYDLCRSGIAKPNYDTASQEGGATIDGESIPF